jgi:hypothetical protein
MVVFGRRSDEGRAVNIGELADGRRGFAAVSALGRVSASAARAFAWRWTSGDGVADRAAIADEPIGEGVKVDALPVSEPQRVVAGLDGGEVVVPWVVDA